MCELCEEEDGCKHIDGNLIAYPLNADDWQAIYLYLRYSYLPFIHAIILRAQAREGQKL